MIDFPASPTLGQQFTAAGVTWTWDGVKWSASGLSVAYLPLSGGSMSGPIVLAADPTANLQAATKQYVDAAAAAVPVGIGSNRIINGDMRVNQRGAINGSAIVYTVDRWAYAATQATKITWSQTNGPPGFPYCLAGQSFGPYTALATDQFHFAQPIEADMVTDFAWGTPSAQPVTLSFWASANITGTFGGTLYNYPTPATRSYPFTFSIPVAGVWTKYTITIPGDTVGTWVMTGNAATVGVSFDLGAGANFRGPAGAWVNANLRGATGTVSIVASNGGALMLTGVKLEIGSVATPYNRQSLAKSLADCQRYYQSLAGNQMLAIGNTSAGGLTYNTISYMTAMRANPTVTYSSVAYFNASALAVNGASTTALSNQINVTAAGQGYATGIVALSAEL